MSIFPTTILLATDGSREAELARTIAIDLAESTNSELHVVTVAPGYPSYDVGNPSVVEQLREQAEDILNEQTAKIEQERVLEGVHLLNTGSVGKPKDGDWRACYALAEVSEEISSIEIVRVEYDLERAVEGILRSELPEEFAELLRTGGAAKPLEVA
jgi:hypothetical protein